MTNRLADEHNRKKIDALVSDSNPIYKIDARDSGRDHATGRCENIVLDKDLNIDQTGNLHAVLKLCIGARVMLTVNDDTEDGLVNGAIGTVKGFRGFRGQKNLLKGEVYVLFDLPEVGCSKKIKKAGMFEGCVAIKAVTRTFTYNKRSKSEILISRKQYPLKFAHAITIHKSQSATYKYMVVDFNRETKSVAYELRFQPGQQYTAFSRGEDRSRIIVKNFNPSMLINVNKKAQDEMKRLQSEMLKDKWCHPLQAMNGFVITQLNIVSWNLHIEHFLSDHIHQSASDIFCFTETHVDSPRVTKN